MQNFSFFFFHLFWIWAHKLGVTKIGFDLKSALDQSQPGLDKQLNDPSTSAKSYWTILEAFYCKMQSPVIPPLLVSNNFSNFKEKVYLFNEFFSKQYTQVANDSTLPPLLETPDETLPSLQLNVQS